PDDGGSAYMALADPIFGADSVDLARLARGARRTNRPLLALAERAAREGELREVTRAAVERFLGLHRRLSRNAALRPTSEVLYELVSESGVLTRLAADESADAVGKVGNLNKLFRIVSRVGPLLRHDRVDQFIHHLDLLIEMGDDPAAA